MRDEVITIADALDAIGALEWALFYGLAVGIGAYLLFILALQNNNDDD